MMTTKRTAYELLLNKSTNAVEQHYSASKVEVSGSIFSFFFVNSEHLIPIDSNKIEHCRDNFILLVRLSLCNLVMQFHSINLYL
jgi:hypothetical protein